MAKLEKVSVTCILIHTRHLGLPHQKLPTLLSREYCLNLRSPLSS